MQLHEEIFLLTDLALPCSCLAATNVDLKDEYPWITPWLTEIELIRQMAEYLVLDDHIVVVFSIKDLGTVKQIHTACLLNLRESHSCLYYPIPYEHMDESMLVRISLLQ